MSIIDKHGVLEKIRETDHIVLELGCGERKKNPAAIGIDQLDYECVDIVGDIFEVLAQFPDQSVAAVESSHFFEHVRDLPRLMEELARVLKPEGILGVTAPHFSNPYFYSDHTHTTPFGLYTFSYFARDGIHARQVPKYRKALEFELVSVDLAFKSPRPFYFRYAVKKLFGALFNLTTWTREFYEESLCWLFPCYEVGYRLKKIDTGTMMRES